MKGKLCLHLKCEETLYACQCGMSLYAPGGDLLKRSLQVYHMKGSVGALFLWASTGKEI